MVYWVGTHRKNYQVHTYYYILYIPYCLIILICLFTYLLVSILFRFLPFLSGALIEILFNKSMVILELSFPQLDGRSFFFDIAPAVESAVSSFVTLLAAAHALRNATQNAQPNRTILYTFFQGVSNVDNVMVMVPYAFILSAVFFVFSCLFHSRRPLTTLAVQEWCMICRTTTLLWIWITFIHYWKLARYHLQTFYRKYT